MLTDYARTFCVLLWRDVRFILAHLRARLFDGAIVVCMQTLAIGTFLPLLGMPTTFIAPIYIGVMTQIIFSAAYSLALRYVTDLHKNKFINYQMALPLPKTWLFAQIIIAFMIEIMFISLPLIALGSVLLGSLFTFDHTNWPLVLLMYLLNVAFYALFFIYLAFNSSYTWFLDNVWARRLSPLFLLGCAYFSWKQLAGFNYSIALLVLLNPLTYVHEGLRTAFLGGSEFLPLYFCVPAVIIFCALLILLLARAVKHRLDPV